MKKQTFGLVLSGGGVRGLAHVGVIKLLEEEGIYPSYISGTSAGAIVGAFYAAGYNYEKILHFFHTTTLFSINKYAYGKPGFIDTDKFYNIFKEYFPEDSFQCLEKKLYISATDILAGKTKYFHEGPLIRTMLASAAFPVVLSPVKINDVIYADGGITNNFPTEPLLAHCDKIIGVYTNPLKNITEKELNSSRNILNRALSIGMANMSIQKFKHCDVVISSDKLSEYGTFSTSYLDAAFEVGYEAAKNKLNELRELTK